jgi:flagellar motor switch/type III secretory pathway protein FliN
MSEATVIQSVAVTPVDALIAGEAWSEAMWLPCTLSVELVIPQFTIGDLLRLEADAIIDSQWNQSADVPLRVNGLVVGYAEFEVIGDKAGVRLTELT